MKFIVTGSNGFIGYHTCRRLMDLGEVIGVDDLSTGSADNEVDGVQYHTHSITDADWLVHLLRDTNPEVVIHLAAMSRVAFSVQYPLRSAAANVMGTISVLNAILKAELVGRTRLVFASSSSVYGGAKRLPTPEMHPCDPQSPYALAKLHGEQWCDMFHRLYGARRGEPAVFQCVWAGRALRRRLLYRITRVDVSHVCRSVISALSGG